MMPYRVLPAALYFVHQRVDGPNRLFRIQRRLVEGDRADTEGDREGQATLPVPQSDPQILHRPSTRLRVCLDKDHREFVAAEPSGDIGVTHMMGNGVPYLPQNTISGGVAMDILDGFEAVQIDVGRREPAAMHSR